MQQPSIGRIVRYTNREGRERAAIIVDCDAEADSELCALSVFTNPLVDRAPVPNEPGLERATDPVEFVRWTPYSETPVPGTWRWPEVKR